MNAVIKVAMTVDPAVVVAAFAQAFSTGTTFVSELLQNAYRANATEVHVTCSDDGRALVIEDSGEGIADFGALLGLVKSGWSDEVRERDRPFGVGFLSALAAASRVQIESGAWRLEADTADILAFRPIGLTPLATHRTGTRIVLTGLKTIVRPALIQSLVHGYPLPVFINGVPAERPHALDQLAGWASTDVGMVHAGDLKERSRVVVYLQGFRVSACGFNWPAIVVHLDPTKYFGRLPDRACLVDHQAANEDVERAVKQLMHDRLRAQLAAIGPEQFARLHFDDALDWKAYPLLTNVDWVPRNYVEALNEQARLERYDGDSALQPVEWSNELIPRHAFSQRHVVADWPDEEDQVAVEYLRCAHAWVLGSRLLPLLRKTPSHWLNQAVTGGDEVLSNDDVTVRGEEPLGTTQCEVDGMTTDVHVFQRLFIAGPFGEFAVPADEGVAVRAEGEYEGGELMVMPQTDSWVVESLAKHYDGNDERWVEEARDASAASFARAMALFDGSSHAEVLQQVLRDADVSTLIPAPLFGSRHVVVIDANGRLTVEEPQA